MKSFTFIVEQDRATGLYVGFVPGLPGAHSQGATLDELRQNMREVLELLHEEGDPLSEGAFVGTETVTIAA